MAQEIRLARQLVRLRMIKSTKPVGRVPTIQQVHLKRTLAAGGGSDSPAAHEDQSREPQKK